MINWDFWIDSWEHPFSSWFRGQSTPAFVEEVETYFSKPPQPEPPVPGAGSEPKPKPKKESSTSWDWSKFNIPIFESGFTRKRLPQPIPGPRYEEDPRRIGFPPGYPPQLLPGLSLVGHAAVTVRWGLTGEPYEPIRYD